MKDMGPVEGEDGVHSFWLSATAEGKKIKELRMQTEKEAAKKANFPGFRKGQIPPYAMPRMTMFAIQEAVIKTCECLIRKRPRHQLTLVLISHVLFYCYR